MARLILLAAVVAIIAVIIARLKNSGKKLARQDALKLLGIVVLALVLLLVVTGRLHWLTAIAAGLIAGARALLPHLLRYFPILQHVYRTGKVQQQAKGGAGVAPPDESSVSTEMFEMYLNHNSGHMNGKVLKGAFCGKFLDDLVFEQLLGLYRECSGQDPDSRELLVSYLNRRFGEDWERKAAPPDENGTLSRQDALAILGLDEGASEADIIKAHRSMMQKVHPDRGGSDYLAARVNAAKDVLLG